MYFGKIFRTFFPNICVSQLFLIASSGMQFQTMPSQSALSSVFRLALKILCSAFNYLHLFERIFSQVQIICKDDFHVLLCVFMLHFRRSFSHTKKTSGIIIVCLGLEKVSFVFYWKEMLGSSLTKPWLDMDLRRCKKDGYVAHWKVAPNLFWHMTNETCCSLTSFKSCIHPWVCIIGHF